MLNKLKGKYDAATVLKDLELAILIVASFCIFAYYGVVSHLSSFRGINTAYFLVTSLDKKIPYQPFWILFYSLAEYVPVLAIILIRFKIGPDIIAIRRIVTTVFILLFFSYCLYWVFPCSVIKMFGVPVDVWKHNILDNLVREEFAHEAPWNANPSLHIAFSWTVFRIFSVYFRKPTPRIVFLIWFLGMAIGTLALRVHIIANVVFGLLMAELCFRYVFLNTGIEKFAFYLGRVNVYARFFCYLLLIVALMAGLHLYLHYFGTLTIVAGQHS